ncbi:MAG TPA: hypothetical protein VLI67_11445, partial [Vicinamibacteria bacterium]|nr:hypothetical protein [Vicinamibacteria bacterium]
MAVEPRSDEREALRTSRGRAWPARALVAASLIGLAPLGGAAGAEGRHCSATAEALFRACGFEAQDDHAKAVAICINVSDRAARRRCFAEAEAARGDGMRLCREQRAGRRDACRALGEGRYDPEFAPDSFDADFRALSNPNPYFPLGIGMRWVYRGGAESNTVEVLDETKRIEGVTCI